MNGLLELGEIVMSLTQRRLESIARNISNMTTPGYKAGTTFQNALTDEAALGQNLAVHNDFAQGGLTATGRNFDLAISGPGFFQLRGETGTYYTRDGQFERGEDGRVVNAQGLALQTADGADLIVQSAHVEILDDGAVLENGAPTARIGVFAGEERGLEAYGGTLFVTRQSEMQAVEAPLLRQGMLEAANVDLAREMMSTMAVLRQAEIGARIVQTYDGLIGQSISTFGRTAR